MWCSLMHSATFMLKKIVPTTMQTRAGWCSTGVDLMRRHLFCNAHNDQWPWSAQITGRHSMCSTTSKLNASGLAVTGRAYFRNSGCNQGEHVWIPASVTGYIVIHESWFQCWFIGKRLTFPFKANESTIKFLLCSGMLHLHLPQGTDVKDKSALWE